MLIQFFEESDCTNPVLRFGAKDASFPSSLVVPIPSPLAIHCYQIDCHNLLGDCEVAVTVTGRWEEPAP